ncbi:MAG: hypothetical protein HY846_06470 [Nitrosomonadales bacterium]|nr:hypothetical protein [Nitrosomonadales bacterium]
MFSGLQYTALHPATIFSIASCCGITRKRVASESSLSHQSGRLLEKYF